MIFAVFGGVCPNVFPVNIDDVQTSIERWIDTNRIISETRRDWASEQTLLIQEAKLLELELAELERKGERLAKLNEQAYLERAEAISRNSQYAELMNYLEMKANALERKVLKIVPAFPKPLQDRIASSMVKIGVRPEDEKQMSVSARMQALVSIISETEKFNHELTLVHEMRTVEAGKPVQVRVLYWGLAGAYAVSPSGEIAQVGHPGFEGWIWEDQPGFALQIAQLIRIREGTIEAEFIQSPMSINEVSHD